MRRLIPVFLAFSAVSPAEAHEHGCLNHHWTRAAYYHELHWQLTAMLLIGLIIALPRLVSRLRRRAVG